MILAAVAIVAWLRAPTPAAMILTAVALVPLVAAFVTRGSRRATIRRTEGS